MWFPAPNFDYSSKDPASLFIAFAWRELFEEYTPQSYQPSLLNTHILLDELKTVATETLKNKRGETYLKSLLEKLKSQANADKVLHNYFPRVQHDISSFEKDTLAKKIEIFSVVTQDKLTDYDDRTYDYFLSILETFSDSEEKGKPKEKMLLALQNLATLAISQGFSFDECRSIVTESTLSLEPLEVGKQILQSLRTERSWRCVFALTGNSDFLPIIKSIGFATLSKDWKPKENTEKFKKILDNPAGYTLLYQDVRSKSASQAFGSSISLLKRVLGAASLYRRSTFFEIAPYAFVEGTSSHLFSSHSGTNLPPSQTTKKLIKELLINRSSINHSWDQAMNTLELYSLVHTSWDLRTQFLHLWVAFETLIGHASEGNWSNRIAPIVARLTPIVARHHLHSVVKYLAICLHQFGFCGTVPNTTGGFTESTADKIRTDELLLALTGSDGKYKQIVNKLLAVVAKHPLLCNRIYTASEGGFKTPEAMKKEFLDNCEELTNWQLRRIYRARNLLVHQGIVVPQQLQYLFEKLNYYYSVTFSKVIHDLQDHPHWSVDHSYEHRRLEFKYLSHLLDNSSSNLTVADVLPREEGSAELLWP
jgi:hypothetical protein